jgi:hypothetical protein
MKFFDKWNGCDTLSRFAPQLTRVSPLWNYPKTVGVAQAFLPVRFLPRASPRSKHQGILVPQLARYIRSLGFLRRNICRGAFVR